jgi:hypothetical protein
MKLAALIFTLNLVIAGYHIMIFESMFKINFPLYLPR